MTLATERVIEARAEEVRAEFRALAEHYRRVIGQRARWHLNEWKREIAK